MLEKSYFAPWVSLDPITTILVAPMEVVQTWRPVMSAAIEWNGRTLETVTTLNKGWLDFVNRRFAEDMALQQHLWGCKSFQDVWGVCNEYSQKAVNDYQRQFAEIATLGAQP